MKALQAALAALVLAWSAPASADDDPTVTAETTDGGLIAGAIGNTPGHGQPTESPGNVIAQEPQSGPAIQLGASACPGAAQVVGTESAVTFCGPQQEYAEPVLTVGDVRTAFARLDLPAATLVIQPPDGLTLVNFDTNFYTTSTRPITRTVTLLGQQVTIEATPAEFHWDFGDGDAISTAEPGAPYPDLTVTHNYLQTGTYRPSLATTFTGRFRVGDGAWRQIPGTVTIDGAGQALRAIEAQPKLVGY